VSKPCPRRRALCGNLRYGIVPGNGVWDAHGTKNAPSPPLLAFRLGPQSPLGSAHPRSFPCRRLRPATLSDAASRAFRRDFGLVLWPAFAAEADKRMTPVF
jgi:hypothetical protein